MSVSIPAAGAIANRLSGIAPLGIVFNACATTSTETSLPRHELLYIWDFGDPAGGAAWQFGTRTGSGSKNIAYGPIVGHVFETPGPHTVTLTVFDGVSVAQRTISITVDNPDAAYSQIHFFSSDTTYAVGTPAHDGVKYFHHDNWTGANDFDTAISTYHATNRALYFEWGDTHACSTTAFINADGPGTVGANPHGSGTKPVITSSGGEHLRLGSNTNHDFGDWRLENLRFTGTSNAITPNGAATRITIHKCETSSDINHSFNMTPFILDGINTISQLAPIWNQWVISGGDFGGTGNGLFIALDDSAVIGNRAVVSGSAHACRLVCGQRVAFSNNEFAVTGGGACLTIRGAGWEVANRFGPSPNGFTVPEHTYTEDIYVVENRGNVTGGTALSVFSNNNSSGNQEGTRWRNIIYDGNWLQTGSSSELAFGLNSDLTTVRNNLIDFTLGTSGTQHGVRWQVVIGDGNAVAPDTVWNYNNTFYSANSSSNALFLINLSVAINNCFVRNFVGVAPSNASASTAAVNGTATQSNNSNNAQIRCISGNTNPLVTSPPTQPSHFQIQVGSHADGTGFDDVPVWNDAFQRIRDWQSPNYDMGAHALDEGSLPPLEALASSPNVIRKGQRIWFNLG